MAGKLTTQLVTDTWRAVEVRISPDGRRVAWVAAPYGIEGDHHEAAIWVADVDGSSVRRWTYGGDDTSPRWSPDGDRLAFLSDRAQRGTAGLYVMPGGGGEAVPLLVGTGAVSAFAWSPDATRLAVLVADEPDEEDDRRARERDDADVFGARWPASRLRIVEVASREAHRLETGEEHLSAVEWSPDGTMLAVTACPTPELDAEQDSRICLLPLEGGAIHQVCLAPNAGDLCFAAGGDRIVFVAYQEPNQVSAQTVWSVPAAPDGRPEIVGPAPEERACAVTASPVSGERRVVIEVVQGLDTRLEWCDAVTGKREPLWNASTDIGAFDVGPGSQLAVVMHSAASAPEVWCGRPRALRRLSDHHGALADIGWGPVTDFRFQSAEGWELDGVWIRPPDAGEGPWPTVVLPHGGPYGRSGRQLHLGPLDWGQWLATAGYAVLMPNYRGGMGHGQAFAASVRGDMGGAEWHDVLAAVDTAIERGIADPDRLGIGGWSQGGFLTAWAVTQTDRFRAGVIGAGPTDWTMLSVTSDLPRFEASLAGGAPWHEPARRHADARSPITHADSITTPLLILHGQQDERVPPSQAIALHRALRNRHVPVELVTYPRAPHQIRERTQQADVLSRVRNWYDRWLAKSP